MKKGEALAINVIIIAILAILVLVIVGVIFTGRAGIFAKETTRSCVANGGVCVSPDKMENYPNSDYVNGVDANNVAYSCPASGATCRIPTIIAKRG